MLAAGLDIGTNTILMVIGDVDVLGNVNVLVDEHQIPRLGEGLSQHGGIVVESVSRATRVLREYRGLLNKHGNPPVVAVATAALRIASNGAKVRRELEQALGAPIHVISGEQEATLTYAGTTLGVQGPVSVIDIGGGSTEVVQGMDGRPSWATSIPVGSVMLSELYCSIKPVPPEQQSALRTHIQSVAGQHISSRPPTPRSRLLAVAGTATALAMLDSGESQYNAAAVQGYTLDIRSVMEWSHRLLGMSLNHLLALPGLDPRRADVLPAGVTILAEVMELLGSANVTISVRGLRYGALLAAAGRF